MIKNKQNGRPGSSLGNGNKLQARDRAVASSSGLLPVLRWSGNRAMLYSSSRTQTFFLQIQKDRDLAVLVWKLVVVHFRIRKSQLSGLSSKMNFRKLVRARASVGSVILACARGAWLVVGENGCSITKHKGMNRRTELTEKRRQRPAKLDLQGQPHSAQSITR